MGFMQQLDKVKIPPEVWLRRLGQPLAAAEWTPNVFLHDPAGNGTFHFRVRHLERDMPFHLHLVRFFRCGSKGFWGFWGKPLQALHPQVLRPGHGVRNPNP